MKKIILLVVAALILGAACVYADDSPAGAAELSLLTNIFTGNIGLTLGLGVVVLGIFALIQGNSGGAIMLIILGVLITLLPGVYNGVRSITCGIAEGLGAHCGTD